jgi:hypothetical protein
MSRINLSDYISKKREGRQTHIELSDGTVLKVDPLELWGDDVLTNAATDQVAAATALLGGDENYSKFKADGGAAALLLTMLMEEQGVSAGEAEPSPS